MSNQRWELTTVEIEFDITKSTEPAGGDRHASWNLMHWVPTSGSSAEKGMSRAQALANQGWELVSVVPVNKALIYSVAGTDIAGVGGASATKKLVLFFKRPIPS